MKLNETIRKEQTQSIDMEFIKNGFSNFWNEYAPLSRFYTKNIDGNKTLYVRRDISDFRNHNIYRFESWIRDNNKNALDKDRDSCKKRYNTINDINKLLDFMKH